MKKFSWGHGLIVFFTCYVGFLIFVVFKSTTIDHSLVVENYYQHDIDYQKMYYDASMNTNDELSNVEVSLNEDETEVSLRFSEKLKTIIGNVKFYRPSNKGSDFIKTYELAGEKNEIVIPIRDIIKGKWILKIRWTDGVRDYYKEESLLLKATV
jgi:nitrogen fixation protein FixH